MPGKSIRYVGNTDAVDLEDGQTVARGHQVSVSPELAKALLEQADNFVAVKSKARARKAPAKAPAKAPDNTPED